MSGKGKRLISSDEAVKAKGQHTQPCSDCPWSRKSLHGWLGELSAQDWVMIAHGDNPIECHVLLRTQCAGLAIYRANVFKSPRDPKALKLPRDPTRVFTSPQEFIGHHHIENVKRGKK